ncbi:MAG: prephenate dehydrogenase/arogenate dehydrogenase family protein [Patescibacteria group bacterium]|jgi:prephenate dehydrogenase
MPIKKTVSIIGFGRFGQLTASVFSKRAEVLIYESRVKNDHKLKAKKIGAKIVNLKLAASADLIILAVPISAAEKVIKQIAPYVRPGSLIVDTCSVKAYPCGWLKKYLPKSVEIMGTHPQFGPVTTKFNFEKQSYKLKGLQIVLCPIRIGGARLGAVKNFLTGLELKVIITTPEDHDRQNAYTLGLVHFVGRALLGAGAREQEIYTPGYTDLLSILPHTTSDNWQLFYDMHNYNPYAESVRLKFMGACESMDERIRKANVKDELGFRREAINKIDCRVFKLLKDRFRQVRAIGKIKGKKGLPIQDKKREEDIIKDKVKKFKMDKNFVEGIYHSIFKEAYRKQK